MIELKTRTGKCDGGACGRQGAGLPSGGPSADRHPRAQVWSCSRLVDTCTLVELDLPGCLKTYFPAKIIPYSTTLCRPWGDKEVGFGRSDLV